MNPDFHKLVQKQVKAAKTYGVDSVENQLALNACREWQDECRHEFRKYNSVFGAMCEHCNLPKESFEVRQYLDHEDATEPELTAEGAEKLTEILSRPGKRIPKLAALLKGKKA